MIFDSKSINRRTEADVWDKVETGTQIATKAMANLNIGILAYQKSAHETTDIQILSHRSLNGCAESPQLLA